MPFILTRGSIFIYLPTYSLGGDSRRSVQPVIGLPVAFSSSVLLVSTISLSSVEMTCCCFRGFFLGEAPGMSSPVAGVFRLEVWVVEGADDKFALGSKRQQQPCKPGAHSFNYRTITADSHAPHLAEMCPLFPPPALFLNLGRWRLAHRLQCYLLQAESGKPQCWPLKLEQEGLQPWLLAGWTEQLRAEMEVQVLVWQVTWEWLGQGAVHLMTAPAALLLLEKAALQL